MWQCAEAELGADDGGVSPGDLSLRAGWHADFEDGFCGYQRAGGYCYAAEGAEYRLVKSPTRSGRFAAAFTLDTDTDAEQARCVRRGTFPDEAYYGAWFFIPAGTTSDALWNLMHLQGAKLGELSGLWDVSVSTDEDGEMHPQIFEAASDDWTDAAPEVVLPADEWFHLQFYQRREPDAAGAVALFVNGAQVIAKEGIAPDGAAWGQWYVGNLAYSLTPAQSTLFVDDVSIVGSLNAR
jgi:hypothetical protein